MTRTRDAVLVCVLVCVGILVLAFVLARQHSKTFADRFRGFPINVAQASRLIPAKELNQVKKDLAEGGVDIVVDDDQWSVYTADGSLSAHFEHTVAVTEAGPRILTPAGAALLQ